MKNLLKKFKSIIIFGLISVLGLSSSISAAPDVALNSTFRVGNVTQNVDYTGSVNAKVDDVVRFEIWYHNTELANSGKVGENVNIKVNIPSTFTKNHVVTDTVAGSNTNRFDGSATVNTEIDTTLQYIPGTAFRRFNTGTNDNPNWVTEKITDSVVNGSGFTIPNLQPCWKFQETITVQARVMRPVVSITKQVKVDVAGNSWATTIDAKPGDTLAYLITFKNEGNVKLNNLIIRDNLPPDIVYIPGSTKVFNTTNPNGSTASDDVIKGGLIIGNYLPGAGGYVRFQAKVPTTSQDCIVKHTNVGIVRADEIGEVYNTAIVNVNYECKPTPPTPPTPPKPPVTPPVTTTESKGNLPSSGPIEAAGGAAGTVALGGASYAWLRSKKAFLTAIQKIK